MLWLARRAAGWGRENLVRSLAGLDGPDVRRWLVREAVTGDFLDGYITGVVVTAGRLYEVVGHLDTDPELVDTVGRILTTMAQNENMGGATLASYEHAGVVLEAYSRAIASDAPTLQRYINVVVIAHYMGRRQPADEASVHAWDARRAECRALLDRPRWHEVAQRAVDAGENRMEWIAEAIAPELGLVFVREA